MGNRRIWWAVGIMLAGLCAAWPFRRTLLELEPEAGLPAAADRPREPSLEPTILASQRDVIDEPSPAATGASDSSHAIGPLLSRPKPTAFRPNGRRVPELAGDFELPRTVTDIPDPRSAVLSEESTSPAFPSVEQPLRTYRIRKHDTLESIAERFLGSPQHADRILAVNQGVILAPQILPVGAEILIPRADQSEPVVRLPGE